MEGVGRCGPSPKVNFIVERALTFTLHSSGGQTFPQLVVFVDEIDSVLNLPFSVNDFFTSMRSYYNQRPLNSTYQHLSFALFGTATPSELMEDERGTPFNIGRSISLHGFKWEEAQSLAKGLEGSTQDPKQSLREILKLDGRTAIFNPEALPARSRV